jgi:hypothetical protein
MVPMVLAGTLLAACSGGSSHVVSTVPTVAPPPPTAPAPVASSPTTSPAPAPSLDQQTLNNIDDELAALDAVLAQAQSDLNVPPSS